MLNVSIYIPSIYYFYYIGIWAFICTTIRSRIMHCPIEKHTMRKSHFLWHNRYQNCFIVWTALRLRCIHLCVNIYVGSVFKRTTLFWISLSCKFRHETGHHTTQQKWLDLRIFLHSQWGRNRGGSENFYYLGKDRNQFFPNIIII